MVWRSGVRTLRFWGMRAIRTGVKSMHIAKSRRRGLALSLET